MTDLEPQPSDGPDYHQDHAAWEVGQNKPDMAVDWYIDWPSVDWYIDWPSMDPRQAKFCQKSGHTWSVGTYGTQRCCRTCGRVESKERVQDLSPRRLDLIEEETMKKETVETYNRGKLVSFLLAALVCIVFFAVLTCLVLWTEVTFLVLCACAICFFGGGYFYCGFRTGNWNPDDW